MTSERPLPQADMHIVIAAPERLDALKLLIAMDFGLRKIDLADADMARTFRDKAGVALKWPEQLSLPKTRLQLLFSTGRDGQVDEDLGKFPEQTADTDADIDPVDEDADAQFAALSLLDEEDDSDDTATPSVQQETEAVTGAASDTADAGQNLQSEEAVANGGTAEQEDPLDFGDSQADTSHSFSIYENAPRPISYTQAVALIPEDNWVLADLKCTSDMIFGDGGPVRGIPVASPPQIDRLTSASRKFVSSLYSAPPPTDSDLGPQTVERQVIVHLCDYASVSTELERARSWPKANPKARADVSVVFYWPQTPLSAPEKGDQNLITDFERTSRAAQHLARQDGVVLPVPLILATGQGAFSAALVSALTTDQDAMQRRTIDRHLGPRVISDAWSDPIGLARSHEYLLQQVAMMLGSHSKMVSLIREAMRSDLCVRIVPLDINGADTRRKTLATTFRPVRTNKSNNATMKIVPGAPVSSFFDPVILNMAMTLQPDHDVWDRDEQFWIPLRTSAVWMAAIAVRPRNPLNPATIEAEIVNVLNGVFDLPLVGGTRAIHLYWK